MKQLKKVLAMFLCFAMCLSMFPTWAFAEEEPEAIVEVADIAEPENEEPENEEPVSEEPENEESENEEPVSEKPENKESENEEPVSEEPENKELVSEASVSGELEYADSTQVSVNSVSVQDITSSGTCGVNLTWTQDDAGVLTISGTGQMTDYA